jgi:inner membrane protein
LGHRGFFHSSFFGLLLSVFVVCFFFRDLEIFSRHWFFYLVFFFLLSASHGILDAFTDGGLGIALLSPFDNTRYFFSWTPIRVSPIGIDAFLSKWGLKVIKSELLWVWLPCSVIVVVLKLIRALMVRN